MQRRHFLQQLCTLTVTWLGFSACARSDKADATVEAQGDPAIARLDKPLSEWRQLLTPAAYAVLFEEATERPFTSPLNDEKRAGTFICAACYLPLFESSTKFDSGTGWPSFYQAITGHTGTKTDYKLILPRTEYHCIRCGGHQGHVFDDGPPPTGQRWCNNGVALIFVPAGEPLPALRT
jgi:peptide-methionine (R)-S-oxide reductase